MTLRTLSLVVLLGSVALSACGGNKRNDPPKAGPDFEAIRDRANESHDSLKESEANKPAN